MPFVNMRDGVGPLRPKVPAALSRSRRPKAGGHAGGASGGKQERREEQGGSPEGVHLLLFLAQKYRPTAMNEGRAQVGCGYGAQRIGGQAGIGIGA
eukprot:1157213-Pelagomonas_calceolata.AAC.10